MVATCRSSENSEGLCRNRECCCFFLDSGNSYNPNAAVVWVTAGGSFVPFPRPGATGAALPQGSQKSVCAFPEPSWGSCESLRYRQEVLWGNDLTLAANKTVSFSSLPPPICEVNRKARFKSLQFTNTLHYALLLPPPTIVLQKEFHLHSPSGNKVSSSWIAYQALKISSEHEMFHKSCLFLSVIFASI